LHACGPPCASSLEEGGTSLFPFEKKSANRDGGGGVQTDSFSKEHGTANGSTIVTPTWEGGEVDWVPGKKPTKKARPFARKKGMMLHGEKKEVLAFLAEKRLQPSKEPRTKEAVRHASEGKGVKGEWIGI